MDRDSDKKTNIDEEQLLKKEKLLNARREKLDELERELRDRENELKARDAKRKQIILRLPESLWRDIAKWAEDDFRSINGQIEYILTRSVKEHRKSAKHVAARPREADMKAAEGTMKYYTADEIRSKLEEILNENM